MMTKYTMTALILLTGVITADARLGETRKQCDQRYGEPISVTESDVAAACVYRKADFEVKIDFEQRKGLIFRPLVAIKLVYSKPDDSGAGRRLPLSDGELKTLLDANVGKFGWRQVDMYIEAAKTSDVDKRVQMLRDADNFTIWSRDDSAQAIHDLKNHTLTVRADKASGHKTLGSDSDMSGF